MTRISRTRLVSVVVTILALIVVPMASARPLENPQAVQRAEGGWFGTALKWLEDLAGFRRPDPGRHHRPGSQEKGGNSTTGGSCIDPTGRPRPGCA
ncbi:MAG TPA: hypothetical protein VGG03_17720 [Thermoanaerobaculia bacterium]|jgi:hypothetical protein